MADFTSEYHKSINEERLYRKQEFYTATQGRAAALRIIEIDREMQEQTRKNWRAKNGETNR